MVAMYSMFIADEIGVKEKYHHSILLYALHHDLSEIITGDISTVAKKFIKSRGGEEAIKDLDSLFPSIKKLKDETGGLGEAVVKLADLIDAAVFLSVEGLGSHAEKVKLNLIKRFDDHVEKYDNQWPHLLWWNARDVLDNALHGEDITL